MQTTPVSSETIIQQLHWRYATKKFDSSGKLSEAQLNTIKEAVLLSASSYGLQPFRVLVIQDPEVRAKLSQAAWNQKQPVDASAYFVFARKLKITEADVEHFIQRTASVRGLNESDLAGYRDMIVGDLVKGPRAAIVQEWTARQSYIALGTLLETAALLGIDACPMEGFDPSKFDEILGLTAKGLGAVVSAAVGFRAADDHYAQMKKVRLPAEEFFIEV